MKLHMAARSRFSTSAVIDSEYLVPWLSAEGPLAYSPTKPPARDYFFQYTWILPGIFNPLFNLREHRYFGSPLKDSARILFDFWANARRGDGPALRRYCQFGFFSDNEVRTPMAASRGFTFSDSMEAPSRTDGEMPTNQHSVYIKEFTFFRTPISH
jgi:hypothetical protein